MGNLNFCKDQQVPDLSAEFRAKLKPNLIDQLQNAKAETVNQQLPPTTSLPIHLPPLIQKKPDQQYAVQVKEMPVNNLKAYIQEITKQKPIKRNDRQGQYLGIFYLKQKNVFYEGEWKNGIPHGYGKVLYQNGRYFQGSFNQGEAQCDDGLFVFPNKSYYRGNVRDSKANGEGRLFHQDQGYVYTGNWQDDHPEGSGRQIFKDGSFYIGEFKNGVKHGGGQFVWEDGSSYDGLFENGNIHGFGVRNFIDGDVYVGNFVNNVMQGQGRLSGKNGQYHGEFLNNKRHGQGEYYYKNGILYIGEFKNNLADGQGVAYYPSGNAVHGIWSQGENISIQKVVVVQKQQTQLMISQFMQNSELPFKSTT